MAEQTNQPVVPAAGNLVIEGAFDISGKDIPEVKGFKVRVVYTDMSDIKKHALRSSIIFAQNKIRTALRKKLPLPFSPGRLVTIDSNGNATLSPEELNQRALDRLLGNPEMLKSATSEQRAIIARALGLQLPAAPVDQQGDDSDEEEFIGYDEDELRKFSVKRLQALAERHKFEGWEEMTKDELVEELINL